VAFFGMSKVSEIDAELVEGYVAKKRKAGLAPRTINRHLNLLHKMLQKAIRDGLTRSNAVAMVQRPGEPRSRGRVLGSRLGGEG
jgi:site-specific recombinase XerC